MKGSVLDLLLVMVMMFSIAIILLCAYWVTDKVSNSPLNLTGDGDYNFTRAMGNVNSGLDVFENMFLLIFVVTCLSVIVLAYFIDSHPIFFIFTFIALLVEIMIGAMLTNVFYEIATSDMFLPIANNLNVMVLTMEQMPLLILIFGSLLMIVLYAKYGRGGNQGGGGGV